jgi:hypothetical protein
LTDPHSWTPDAASSQQLRLDEGAGELPCSTSHDVENMVRFRELQRLAEDQHEVRHQPAAAL